MNKIIKLGITFFFMGLCPQQVNALLVNLPTYYCKGKVDFQIQVAQERLGFLDPRGVGLELKRERARRGGASRLGYYSIPNHDGYGGSAEIFIPLTVAGSTQAVQSSFEAFLIHTQFSELGKVSELRTQGKCKVHSSVVVAVTH